MPITLIYSASADDPLAKRLYADLWAGGVRPWLAIYDVLPGCAALSEVQAAYQAASAVLLLTTKDFMRDPDLMTFALNALAGEKLVLPIIADKGLDLPENYLQGVQLKRRYGEAVKELLERLPHDSPPVSDLPALQRGNEAYHLGDFEGALEAYSKGLYDDPRIAHGLSATYNALRRHAEALEWADKAISADPTQAVFYRNRSLAYAGLGQAEKALPDDEKAIALEPHNPANWSSHAMSLVAVKRFEEAKAQLAKAQELDPQAPTYWYQLGYVYTQAGDDSAALQAYDAALALNPAYTDALAGKRMSLGRLGRYEEALAEIDQDIKRNPRKGGGYVMRSLVNFYMERYAEAVKDATAALERGRDSTLPALFNRAIAYWKLGESDKAGADFLQAIQLYPSLGTTSGVRDSAESEATLEVALAILDWLKAAGRLP